MQRRAPLSWQGRQDKRNVWQAWPTWVFQQLFTAVVEAVHGCVSRLQLFTCAPSLALCLKTRESSRSWLHPQSLQALGPSLHCPGPADHPLLGAAAGGDPGPTWWPPLRCRHRRPWQGTTWCPWGRRCTVGPPLPPHPPPAAALCQSLCRPKLAGAPCLHADCLADQLGKPKEEVTSW